jgi:Zinc finger, C2H2 type
VNKKHVRGKACISWRHMENVADFSVIFIHFARNAQIFDIFRYMSHVFIYFFRFECEICGRGFSERFMLKRHLLVHSSTQQFECDVCQKKFSRKDCLLRHAKLHGDPDPTTCNKEFVTVDSLATQKISIHLSTKVALSTIRKNESRTYWERAGRRIARPGRGRKSAAPGIA